MRKYLVSDFCIKIYSKTWDYLLKVMWMIALGHIGKGSFVRSGVRIIGNPRRVYIGEQFKIYQRVVIAVGKGEVKIGNSGLIGVGTYINCGKDILTIGDNVAIAPYCKIFTNSHHYAKDKLSVECYDSGNVTIGDNVLIGTGTVILPNVKIGSGSVIGACSLINKDIEPNSIVAGIPARFIRYK